MKSKVPSSDDIINKVLDYIDEFFFVINEDGKLGEARFETEALCICLAAVVVVMASACWSASIAAARRHNVALHFLLGLILPVIYPVIILFAMNIPGKWDLSSQKQEETKQEEPEEEADTLKPDESGNIPYEPTQAYFTKISRTDDGQPAGPWDVVFNGNKIVVTQIIEALPECINVAFYDAQRPEEQRTMRIPFTRIESWTPKA